MANDVTVVGCSWCGFNAAMPDSNECESCSRSMHNRSDIEMQLARLQAENAALRAALNHFMVDIAILDAIGDGNYAVSDALYSYGIEFTIADLRKAAVLLASLDASEPDSPTP